MNDVAQLFARAEAAFQAGRLADARVALDSVEKTSKHPAVFHLRALVEKQDGDIEAAGHAFVEALRLAPEDPQINNNYANLLGRIGRADAALAHYERALAAMPGFADARLNRALLLQNMSRDEEALGEFDIVLAVDPRNTRAQSARGASLRNLGRLSEAASAYDTALSLTPSHRKALEGRARIGMERGEPDASAHYRRALAPQPGDLGLLLGLCDALEAEGNSDGLALLADAVAARPEWFAGHERLAEMRAEAHGGGDDFARSYKEALLLRPDDRDLHYSYWRALALGGRYQEAINAMDAARQRMGEDREMLLMEAAYRSEVGEAGRAEELFADLGDDPAIMLVRGRTLLRRGDAAKCAALFEQVVARRPDDIAAWAYLGLAWRLTGDSRHEWLCMQAGLFGTIDLAIDPCELDDIAAVIRGLHRTRAHPLGQSLRGGTQTRGRLFWRGEPEITRLREAIEDGLVRFQNALPPRDPSHPLLRHRDACFHIEGSWSVRLAQAGFHINHIHPHGVLSSACYISLPETLGDEQGREGWLEIGSPPEELRLPLKPLTVIEPKPGRLALFSSYLFHGTRPFASGERLTVAFDAVAA